MKKDNFSQAVSSAIDIDVVNKLVDLIVSSPENFAENRKGGYLVVGNIDSGIMVARPIGEFLKNENDTNRPGIYKKEWEEIKFLGNATSMANHLLFKAFYDAQADKKMELTGGVRIGSMIVVFSGFPEKISETLSLIYAIYFFYRTEISKGLPSIKSTFNLLLPTYERAEEIEMVTKKIVPRFIKAMESREKAPAQS